MGRAPCCDKANVKKGPWSPEEDAKLKAYIEHHGTGGNWIALPQKIGLKRCGKSCRLRWLNYLRPNIKHGGFSEEEDNIICSLYVSIGSRWSIIAAQLPGRTDNDIKNYWNTRLKKKLLAKQRINHNNKDHHDHQPRRFTTLIKQHQQQQQQQQDQIIPTPPNYWPTAAEQYCVPAPIVPLIIPNNASTIVQQADDDYDQSPSSFTSFLKELDGIKFSHDDQPQQPYIINTSSSSSHSENQLVYHPSTMVLSSSSSSSSDDAANILHQGYYYDENLFFPTSSGADDDLMMSSHLVSSVNPPPQEQGACLYGMAITGSTSTTDQTTATYSWGDMTSFLTNYSPNLVSTHHHYNNNNEDNDGCRQAGIPPPQDANTYFGIQLQ